MELIKDKIDRGIRWLDKVRPNWWEAVNLDTFDFMNPNLCILGQVFGFEAGCRLLPSGLLLNYGLDAAYGTPESTWLADRWVCVIRLRRAVAAGIYRLDTVRPGWRSSIVLEALEMGSCSCCVLGQLYGDYDEGCSQLGLTDIHEVFKSRVELGFSCASITSKSFKELTDEWVRQLVLKGV